MCESRGGRPGLPVPNSPYGLCGHKATMSTSEESHHNVVHLPGKLADDDDDDDDEVLLYVHKNRRLIRDGSPGRPPRLSHTLNFGW